VRLLAALQVGRELGRVDLTGLPDANPYLPLTLLPPVGGSVTA
jgi:hypothetical protein